jgi:hypothetical protein|nr:MAG TPA: hypothetical protein [Caudoviricetes sp.]
MRVERQVIGQGQYGVDIILQPEELTKVAYDKMKSRSEDSVIADTVATLSTEVTDLDTGKVTSATQTVDSPSMGESHYMIPEGAIAVYKQLLGTSSDAETIQYLMHIRDNGEPAPKPDGTNAWTSAYEELESKLALGKAAQLTSDIAMDASSLSNIVDESKSQEVPTADESKSQDGSTADKIRAANAMANVAEAKRLVVASFLPSDSSEPTGIDKTRSMLGLPSRDISKEAKLNLMKAASANALALESSSEVQGDDTFYEIPEEVISAFDQYNVEKAEADFLTGLIPRW